jgi:hypothetical protein
MDFWQIVLLVTASLGMELFQVAAADEPASPPQGIIAAVKSDIYLNEPEDVLIDGDCAYIPTRSGARLSVYDISDPHHPRLASSFTDLELTEPIGVAKHGNILYLVSWHNCKLLILDATKPTALRKISSLTIGKADPDPHDPDELRKVFYQDGYAYLTHSAEGRLYIVNVADPKAPVITGSVATGDGAFAVLVKGDYAYVGGCFAGASLKVIDVSDKAKPVVVKTLSSPKYDCTASYAMRGNELYAIYYSTNSFVIFDIADPPNSSQKSILTNPALNHPNRLALTGNTAYVASAGGGALVQVDITDSSHPTLGSVFSDPLLKRAYGVACHNGKVFAVGRAANSLVVFDPKTVQAGE